MANALGITELTDTQAGKYLTVNNMVKYLSALMTGVRDIPTSPPGSPVENGAYIIGSGGNTGAWSSFAVNDLVFYLGSAWYKLPPIEGLRVWVWDEDACYVYSGSAWAREPQEVGERRRQNHDLHGPDRKKARRDPRRDPKPLRQHGRRHRL